MPRRRSAAGAARGERRIVTPLNLVDRAICSPWSSPFEMSVEETRMLARLSLVVDTIERMRAAGNTAE